MTTHCACAIYATLLLALSHHVAAQNGTSLVNIEQAASECPMGASIDMERDELLGKLFPGLFVNKKDLRPKKMDRNLAKMMKWQVRRRLKVVAFNTEQDCCEM